MNPASHGFVSMWALAATTAALVLACTSPPKSGAGSGGRSASGGASGSGDVDGAGSGGTPGSGGKPAAPASGGATPGSGAATGSGGTTASGGAAGVGGGPPGTGGDGGAAGHPGGGGTPGSGDASGTGGGGVQYCGLDSDCHGLTCCGGICVDRMTDLQNCGGCFNTCNGDHPFCEYGTCKAPLCFDVACGAGTFCCGAACCPDSRLCCIDDAYRLGCFAAVNGTCPVHASGTDPGAGGASGTGGATGGTPQVCSFQIAATLSAAIPTVGVVDWSTDLPGLTSARIEFALGHPRPDQLNTGSGGPIDIGGAPHRALMLGMKPGRAYTFRIIATAGSTDCVSPDQTLTTGDVAPPALVTRTATNAAAQAQGFIIATSGVPGSHGAGPQRVYIIDADGDVVWWAGPRCSAAAR